MAELFKVIYQRACERKGGERQLKLLLSVPLQAEKVAKITDDRFLAGFTKKVFQSGFVWRVIEQKWPAFEELFFGFDVEKMLLMSDEMFEQRATDKRIVRNAKKVMTIRVNALMIKEVSAKHGSFGQFAASFQGGDIIQLWQHLKKHGARLGGNTGPYALRALGVDTYLLSADSEAYFRHHEIISGGLSSQRSQRAIADQFTEWQQQSGLSLQQISQILAYSWGPNRVNL